MTKMKKFDKLKDNEVRIIKLDKNQIEEIIHDYVVDNIDKLANLDTCEIVTHTIIDLKSNEVIVYCVNENNKFNTELDLQSYKKITLQLKTADKVCDKKNDELMKLLKNKE